MRLKSLRLGHSAELEVFVNSSVGSLLHGLNLTYFIYLFKYLFRT